MKPVRKLFFLFLLLISSGAFAYSKRTEGDIIVDIPLDLQGDTLKLGNGSSLIFRGKGHLKNGVIIGQNSSIVASHSASLFSDISIDGTWRIENIYSNWFDFGSDGISNTISFQNLFKLSSDDSFCKIHIAQGEYSVVADKQHNFQCITVCSNSEIILDGTLLLEPNDLSSYTILNISGKENVFVHGKGAIIGDVEKHTGKAGEWGIGIEIISSRNVSVKDLLISNCWGDCVYIGQKEMARDSYSENVLIDGITCSAGRRQGLSIIAGKNVRILNSKFVNTGTIQHTSPSCGIDIEPNKFGEAIVENILIDGCLFCGNDEHSDLNISNIDETSSVRIRNCVFAGKLNFTHGCYNVLVDSCEIGRLQLPLREVGHLEIKNSHFQTPLPWRAFTLRMENCTYPGLNPRAKLFIGFCVVFAGIAVLVVCSVRR